jgi:hypothetical protein
VLEQAAITESQGRAADAQRMPGQRQLAETLFADFARVVDRPS